MADKAQIIHRARDLAFAITEQRSLEIIDKTLEVLSRPVPDTFLGRKTYEPFPLEKARS